MLWICAALAADVVAVLPFESNSVRPELLPLGPAATDMLVTDLSRVPGLVVVERSRIIDVLAELELQSSGFVDPDTAVRIGQGLGANRVVVGSVNTASVGLRIDARVVDVSNGQVAAGASSTGAEADFFALEEDVARQLYGYFGASLDVTGTGKPATLEDAVEGGSRLQTSDAAYLSMLAGVQKYRRERLYLNHGTSDFYWIQRGSGTTLNLYDLTQAGVVPVERHERAVRTTRVTGWALVVGGAALTAGSSALLAQGEPNVGVITAGGFGITIGPLAMLSGTMAVARPRRRIDVATPGLFESPDAAEAAVDAHNRTLAEELGVPERKRMEIEAERVTP
ncbi:MAG: CsgG/HfaB family protein [Myxococcota bacterium]